MGDASEVDTIRVEWPTGAVQEFSHVAANQTLTITEPPRLTPSFLDGSGFKCHLIGQPGTRYGIETSSNLLDWVQIFALTNSVRMSSFADSDATNYSQRFYRAVQVDPALSVNR